MLRVTRKRLADIHRLKIFKTAQKLLFISTPACVMIGGGFN
jgi:hypothetical protein